MSGAVFILLMLGVTRLPEKYRYAFLQFTDAFCESQNYASFKALAMELGRLSETATWNSAARRGVS